WWAHQLPDWFHRLSLIPMYLIELVLPFAIIFGRWGRLAAGAGFTLLMSLILITGNYTYFNWLTIVLCLPLIHDRVWPMWLRTWLQFEPLGLTSPPALKPLVIKLALVGPFILALALLNGYIILSDLNSAPGRASASSASSSWIRKMYTGLVPFHFASGYGLFRTMTTERPEILIEGSDDGTQWIAYDFVWKVDEISDRPKFVAPHQPRVAWQFWFAALEGHFDYRSANAVWIESLVLKLLEGDSDVQALIKNNPFPVTPPKFIRARLFRYEFTTTDERNKTGDWWKRSVIGEYLPAVSRPPAATTDSPQS
ncbi:MAG: lipase maturation factor family protein, partial [Verrucomicrobiales bacterium]|nr:lipase maturation factor family protein [Verrucomicrobiales bacterium]